MTSLRIDHVVIAITNWERSNAFYRDVLGAEIDQKDQWFAHYRFDGWMHGTHVYFRDPDGSLLEFVSCERG